MSNDSTISVPTKQCPSCHTVFPHTAEHFFREKNTASGLKGTCKKCMKKRSSAYHKKYRAENKERLSAYHKKWKGDNVDHVKTYSAERYEQNEEAFFAAKIGNQYGLTLHTYKEMLQAQNGVCAICHYPCSRHKRLSVDHDHDSGKVRGLLCVRCNLLLGVVNDSPEILRNAALYLRHNIDVY